MIRAVLLDLYGTLVDVGERTWPYRALLAGSARPVPPQDLMRQRHSVEELIQVLGCKDPAVRDVFLRELSRELASVVMYPDTMDTLVALRAEGFKLGLVSNLSAPYAGVVEGTALGRCFDSIVLSCDVGWVKPESEIFERALLDLDVESNEAVMVGDNVVADCMGARRAGMAAIHLCRGGSSREARVIHSLDELISQLRRGL